MASQGETGYALIMRGGRSIDTLVPHVVVTESHRDELIITQHPVEGGGVISDHAFKRPSEVEMQVGYSNATAKDEGYVKQAYQELLALQLKRRPFKVSTGKRTYKNMVLRSIAVVTDSHTENVLMVNASLQEVIIVSTQTTGTGTDTTKPTDDKDGQTKPETTEAVKDKGTQEAKPVSDAEAGGAVTPGTTPLPPERPGEFGGATAPLPPERPPDLDGTIALPPIDVPGTPPGGTDIGGALTGGNTGQPVPGSGFSPWGGV